MNIAPKTSFVLHQRHLLGIEGLSPEEIVEVALTLVKLAQLAADFPEVRELDINPLLADQNGALALDARICHRAPRCGADVPGQELFALRGASLSRGMGTAAGPWRRDANFRATVEAEDGASLNAFLQRVNAEDLSLRFFAPIKDFSHVFLARLTRLDYPRAMAFAALDEASGDLLGIIRLSNDANYKKGEYAVLVRSDLQGRGLG